MFILDWGWIFDNKDVLLIRLFSKFVSLIKLRSQRRIKNPVKNLSEAFNVTIFAKRSILDVCRSSDYASDPRQFLF